MSFRLATTQRCCDNELMFGMPSCQLSEIFWEIVELLKEKFGSKLDLNLAQLLMRAEQYAAAIHAAGLTYENCFRLIGGAKIRKQRLGGLCSIHLACSSGHKRVHCLIYQTLSTPDVFIFAIYGPVEGRRHDLILPKNSGW